MVAPYLRAVLRFWWVVVLCAVAGTALAALALTQSSFTATQLYRVNAADSESARATQLTQTLSRVVDSDEIYKQAAGTAGTTPADLKSRTVIAVVTDTEILSISVTAGSAAAAADQVGDLNEAIRVVLLDEGRSQYADAGDNANGALMSGALRDPAAEEARRTAIGTATAERQNSALATSAQLNRVGDPAPPIRAGLGPTSRAALGAGAGAAVGLLLTSVFGPALVRVRSRRDLAVVFPPVEAYDHEGIARIAARLRSNTPRSIAVLSIAKKRRRGRVEHAAGFARSLQKALENEGIPAALRSEPRTGEPQKEITSVLAREDIVRFQQIAPRSRGGSARPAVTISSHNDRQTRFGGPAADLVVVINGTRVRDFLRVRRDLTDVPMMAVIS